MFIFLQSLCTNVFSSFNHHQQKWKIIQMSLNWCIGNIHSLQWNPTQQLKINYVKSKKADSKASSCMIPFSAFCKDKTTGTENKSNGCCQVLEAEGGTDHRRLWHGRNLCGSYKDHRHPSKHKSCTLTREKFTVCKWQLFKKSFPHSIKTEHKDKKYKVMICLHSVLYKYKHHC